MCSSSLCLPPHRPQPLTSSLWLPPHRPQPLTRVAEFGSGQNKATLSATCEREEARVSWMAMAAPATDPPETRTNENVTVYLENVALTCAGASLSTACAAGAEDAARPKLFTCNYVGKSANKTFGPMVRPPHPPRSLLYVSCPRPKIHKFAPCIRVHHVSAASLPKYHSHPLAIHPSNSPPYIPQPPHPRTHSSCTRTHHHSTHLRTACDSEQGYL